MSDACPQWRREKWMGSIHWHVLMPCLAMYASNVRISVAILTTISQFPLCRVRPSISCTWISFLMDVDYAINNNLTPFISMQNHYNLIYREEEREMFPTLNVCAWMCFIYTSSYLCLTVVQCSLHPLVSYCSWTPLQAFDRGFETKRDWPIPEGIHYR